MIARRGIAAGAPNGLAQDIRVGFLYAERILSAHGGEAVQQPERVDRSCADRPSSLLVQTANRAPSAASASSAASKPGNGRDRSAICAE